MGEEERRKLNRKIAKYVGFKHPAFVSDALEELEALLYLSFWMYPDKTSTLSHVLDRPTLDGLPDFTRSFDECIRWVVPKMGGVVTLTNGYKGWAASINLGEKLFSAGGNGEEAAMAFCLAMEKVLDG